MARRLVFFLQKLGGVKTMFFDVGHWKRFFHAYPSLSNAAPPAV